MPCAVTRSSVFAGRIGVNRLRMQDRGAQHADSDHCDADDAQPDNASADVRHRPVTAHGATVTDTFALAHLTHAAGHLGEQSLG